MSTVPADVRDRLARVRRVALLFGFVGALGCVAGGFLHPAVFFRAYLSAYLFWLGIPLGSLAILMLYHLTGGAWGFLIRRPLEAATRTLPLLALLFVPIACALPQLYVWARPEEVATN